MLCSSSFTSFGVYKHHIGNYHGWLIEEYRAKFGKHGEVINKINCKVVFAFFLCCAFSFIYFGLGSILLF